MMPVKICGITNLKDAKTAVRCGATALGFIFYKQSSRYISPATAGQIVLDLKGLVSFAGVFVDEALDYINAIAEEVGLQFIQLHGNESSQYSYKIHLPVIKVFRVSSEFDSRILNSYDVHAFLFDSYEKYKPGGTGKVFNWNLIDDLKTDTPIILSGGLNIENIEDGINAVLPSAVDINSGVESMPGVKDEKKIKELFDLLIYTESISNPFEIPIVRESSDGL